MLCVELTINHNKLITCVCYRPPNSLVQFWDQLQYIYDLIWQAGYNQIILTGDFNSDPQTTNGKKLDFFVGCNNLKLHVHQQTRITDISASILDQFITTTNVNMNNVCVMPPLATSDHCQIASDISLCIQKQTCITRLVWFYSRADWNGINEAIIDYDWNMFEWCLEIYPRLLTECGTRAYLLN